MNYNTIKKLQKENGLTEMQSCINSGLAWHLEGTVGRNAMSLIEQGACMLGEESRKDFWGNTVPSRKMVKEGTKGSFLFCASYWDNQD